MFVHEIYKGKDPSSVIVRGSPDLTYGEFSSLVQKYRNTLSALGVRSRDRVALYSQNCIEFILVYMAVVSLGAVIIPLNFSLVGREVDFIVRDSMTSLLVTEVPFSTSVKQVSLAELDKRAKEGTDKEAPPFPADQTEDDVCSFVYTSGTTGSPKGAMITHKNLIRNVEQVSHVLHYRPEDRVLCVLPMFHCYGWTVCVLLSLWAGSSLQILRTKNPISILHAIRDNDLTVAAMVPPMYHLMAKRGRASAVKSVRYFISGGAALPQPVAQAFEERYGHVVLNGYGLTEASPVVSMLPEQEPKYMSAGPSLPGVEVKIVTEKPGPYVSGTVGELWVRGDNVMKGYWHREEETKHTLVEGGWLRTGDLAYMDQDGFLYIVDRIKDLIIVNGENVYPKEVEECIYELDDVSECAVVGHHDELHGQVVWAYVVMKEGRPYDESRIRKYLAENLAPYKIPRRFIPMDALPKNATGKILKRALK
jgi:long-chain acyl-CoA synthetase